MTSSRHPRRSIAPTGPRGSRVGALPRIDAHETVIDAPSAAVWTALTRTVERSFAGAFASRFARVVGCSEVASSGPLAEGSTIVGFRVATFEPERRLALEGGHRFSIYRLTFELDPLDASRTRICAITDAVFPGAGRLYRLAVIGTGAHRLVVRRMLRHVARRAEAP